MKIKLFVLILTGFFIAGITALKADNPVGLACPDDSLKAVEPVTIPTFSVLPQFAIPVNEGEIRAGLLYDAVNEQVVWQKNINGVFPIASLTKMMVALLAMEDIKAEKFSWTNQVNWTRESIVGRKRNRKKVYSKVSYSLRDVFKASMIASNNECAEQLARYLGNGNLQSTIDRMNVRAKELGMTQTYFGNPTGLPAPHRMFDNSSTPSDLLLLSLEMLKYPEITEIAAMGYASIENGAKSSVIHNHNRLTIDYSGEVDGLKTGYTKRAGFCLVATTAKCDHRLISIVLGCRGPAIRNEVVRDMMNDYYASISLDRLSPVNSDGTTEAIAQINGVNGKYVTVYEPAFKSHTVRKGESLSRIAQKYKCTTSQLKSWNKKIKRDSKVYAGQKLAVKVSKPKSIFIQDPVNGSETDDDKPLITESEKKDLDKAADLVDAEVTVIKQENTPAEKYLIHTVAPGDTLFSIAKRYDGVSVEELKSLNKITNIKELKPGTKLKVKVQG